MRMPPERRYVVANWIAGGVAVASVAVGTTLLHSARDELPARIVLHWDDAKPDILVSLPVMLLLAGLLTLGISTLILLLGRLAAGSWRHTWSSGALTAAVGLPVCLYGVAWAQRKGLVVEPPPVEAIFGLVYGSLAGNVLRAWLRPRPWSPRAEHKELLAPQVRVAWVGRARLPWSARIGSTAGVALMTLLLAWWTDAWGVIVAMGGVATLLVAAMGRTREVTVDYSGVGLRRGNVWVPSPIKMAEIRAVGVSRVSALRDFAGWGYRVAADGTEGWITRSGDALIVHRHDKPDFVFTIDDAAGAAGVLETFLARSEVA